MAQELLSETLGSSSTLSSDISADQTPISVSATSSTSGPSLSKSISFSRLNAKAPEFVPTRSAAVANRHDLQQHPLTRIEIPQGPPPPSVTGIVHGYRSPTYVPIQGQVGVPNHVQVYQNHHPLQQKRRHHQQYQVHHHPLPHQYYGVVGPAGGFAGEQEAILHVQQGQFDPTDHVVSSRNGFSEESNQKILKQVEYYFSDINLATTDHLMRFINKDPEGYVPLSVVLSFNKIKTLVSNYSQLATILRNSSKLMVSEDGMKVKRQHPLTESDMDELQTRIVVAENLPEDHCHQNLMKVFSAVGSVKTIRTCQPQPTIAGASSSRPAKGDGISFNNKLHAFVEYESIELAEKAVLQLNNKGNWRNGLKVHLLISHVTRGKKGHETEGICEEDDASTSNLQSNEKQSDHPSQQWDASSHDQTGGENLTEKEGGGQKKVRSRGRGKGGRGRNQHNNNNNRGNHHVGNPHTNNYNVFNNEQPHQQQQQPGVFKLPPGPRMPDGTRGFAVGRGKPLAVNIS